MKPNVAKAAPTITFIQEITRILGAWSTDQIMHFLSYYTLLILDKLRAKIK